MSEGGLAAAAAEMAFAGGLGAPARRLKDVPAGRRPARGRAAVRRVEHAVPLRSPPGRARQFEAALAGVPHARIGEVTGGGKLEIVGATTTIAAELSALKEAWQKPLRW